MSDTKQKATIVKKATNKAGKVTAVLYSDGKIKINGARISYPHLFEKYKGKDDKGTPAYGAVFLLPKDTHREAMLLIKEAIAELCKENKVKDVEKKFLRDGDKTDKPENAGMYIVSARDASKRPILRDKDKRPLDKDDEDDRELIQPGVIVNGVIRPWFQNNSYGKRANAGLVIVQFVEDDGVRFGEGGISDETVDEMLDDESEDDDGDSSGSDDDDI